MKAIIIDATHRKCPYCYAGIERKDVDTDSGWARRTYCTTTCAAKGGHLARKQAQAAKRRIICGDS